MEKTRLENEPIYPIGIAAKLLAVHPRTLRLYENGGLILPERRHGRRYYSNNDIKWIKCIRALIHKRGISIPGIRMLLAYAPCWEIKKCPEEKRLLCKAYTDRTLPCWERMKRSCHGEQRPCDTCELFLKRRHASS